VSAKGIYRKVRNRHGKVKHVIWDPNIDTIELMAFDSHPDRLPSVPSKILPWPVYVNPLPLFEKQFRTEMQEVKYLVLPSSLWLSGKHEYVEVIWSLIDFLSLKELVVVVDEKHERNCVTKVGMLADLPFVNMYWTLGCTVCV